MIEGRPPTKDQKHPDLIYILYESPGDVACTKSKLQQYKYRRSLKYSLISFVNAHIKRYLMSVHRPLSFDYTCSCSNSFHDYEIIQMPDIYIYASESITIEERISPKIYVRSIQPIIDMCPIDVFDGTPYIPGLKAATLLYHANNSDTSREFILSDVDIVFYNVKTSVDPLAIYLCGLEYQPLFSFLAFEDGLNVFSSFGKTKQRQIDKYKEYEKYLKLPIECQIFNNGIIKVPRAHIHKFFTLYYDYLKELKSVGKKELSWPWPFWTAEMFATNYAVIRLAIEDNVPIRRFDPDVMDVIHDINGQFDMYLQGILEL